jgi:mannose-6-phosphate isomerase-like protein (cupin superfamily)
MKQFLRLVALASVSGGLALAATAGAYGQATQTVKGTGMQGFVGDIEELSVTNSDFRRVLYTGKKLQLVVMTLKPGEGIGEEVHEDGDQFFRVEEGEGEVLIDGTRSRIRSGDAVLIPAGARHNIVNTGKGSLHVYTLYAPPEHRDRTVHPTKADAEKSPEHFDGKTTE